MGAALRAHPFSCLRTRIISARVSHLDDFSDLPSNILEFDTEVGEKAFIERSISWTQELQQGVVERLGILYVWDVANAFYHR